MELREVSDAISRIMACSTSGDTVKIVALNTLGKYFESLDGSVEIDEQLVPSTWVRAFYATDGDDPQLAFPFN